MPEKKLTVSASPHVRSAQTVSGIMLNVIIALIPALAASIWLFGPRVLLVCLVTVGTCMLSEYLLRRIMKRSNTLGDLSAVVTGLLLAFNLPVSIPLWQAAIGSVVAIVVVKQLFGGIGQNFVNPAITGRIILMVSFIGTVAVIMLIAGKGDFRFVAYQLLSGGLMLGAFFMATDYTTSPINFKGRIIFGIGCGLLTSFIRLFGSLPEGVSFSIILMNILVPHIENLTTPKPFGTVKEKKEKGAEKA